MGDSVRHDAQYSDAVVGIFRELLTSDKAEIDGPVVDPFGGAGKKLHMFGRDDVSGMEIEPEWARASKLIRQGDALKLEDYPDEVGCIATSPCYGNRFADQYLGPVCRDCKHPTVDTATCTTCEGVGRDTRGRYSYAISLGHEVRQDSAARLHFHNNGKGTEYRAFHRKWLELIATQVLQPGPRRLLLNMKDHYRTTDSGGVTAQRRQYVCDWWLHAAHKCGFRLVAALPALTPGMGYGANMQTGKADHEMVFVFDLLRSSD